MQENCPQIPVRNSVEFGVALDAHKFSKDSCGKIVCKFATIHMHTTYVTSLAAKIGEDKKPDSQVCAPGNSAS